METPIKYLGRELLSNGGVSQAELVLATGLPSWKISRIFKRLELLKFIEVEKEPRFTRGRPRKVGRLTSEGVEYFRELLGEARDEDSAGSCASSVSVRREGDGDES
jgi:DNA-binding MarR family transcriptional regulator